MSEATFTIHDYIKYLVDSGDFTEKQVEALADANVRLRRAEQEGDDGLVTKKDMRGAFAEHEVRQLKWGFGLLAGYFIATTATNTGMTFALLQALLP